MSHYLGYFPPKFCSALLLQTDKKSFKEDSAVELQRIITTSSDPCWGWELHTKSGPNQPVKNTEKYHLIENWAYSAVSHKSCRKVIFHSTCMGPHVPIVIANHPAHNVYGMGCEQDKAHEATQIFNFLSPTFSGPLPLYSCNVLHLKKKKQNNNKKKKRCFCFLFLQHRKSVFLYT